MVDQKDSMHAHATLPPQPAAVTAPPLAVFQCPHCGSLPIGAPHREDCFPAFQAELLRAYPALRNAISLHEAEVIERVFRLYAGMIHMLRPRFPGSADDCVERRWEEASAYVERLLARHARHTAAQTAPGAAAAS
jgi:hypothetical protein